MTAARWARVIGWCWRRRAAEGGGEGKRNKEQGMKNEEWGWYRIACVVFCLCLSCDGCNKKSKAPGAGADEVKAATPAGSRLSRREAAQRLLQMIPAGSEALVALDINGLYRVMGDLEAALKHTPLGQELVRKVRLGLAGAPVRVPWEKKDLARLGLDPDGVAAAFGSGEPDVFVFSISDPKAFKSQIALLLGAEASAWKTVKRGEKTIHQLTGKEEARCHFARARVTCAASEERLLSALSQRGQRSVWDTLPSDIRDSVERTALLLTTNREGSRATGTLKVLTDGVSLEVRASDKNLLKALSGLGGGAGDEGTLLGLARDALSVFCLRLNMAAVMATMPVLAARIAKLGVKPQEVAAALTGEVLVLEQADRSPVLLVGSKDRAVASKLVKGVALALRDLARDRQGGGSTLEVTPLKHKGTTAYGLKVRPRKGQRAGGELDLRLVAGPRGIMLGKVGDVSALAASAANPPEVARFRQTLDAAVDRTAFGPGLLLASRSLVREPFASVPGPDAVEKMIGAGHFPLDIKRGFEVIRFLFDQLHHQTLGVVRLEGGGLRLVLRLTTLHRHGHAGDDRARALYIKGLVAKHRGQQAAYEEALRLLKKDHAGTRYGALSERKPGGLSGPVLLLGAAAAVVLPAYIKASKQ